MPSGGEHFQVRSVHRGTREKDNPATQEIVWPFGKFEIVIELTEDNKFVGVTEVRISKDFRTIAQKLASSKGPHDVEEFYQE